MSQHEQPAGEYVSMADHMGLRQHFNIVVAQWDNSNEALEVHRAVLTRYIREEKILDAAKLNADLRNMAA